MDAKETYHLYRKPEFSLSDIEKELIRSKMNAPTIKEFGMSMINRNKKKKKR